MTTAQVVETSVTVNDNSPIQDYVNPDDQTQPTFETFFVLVCIHPGTSRVPPRVLASGPKPCGGNKCQVPLLLWPNNGEKLICK